MFSLNTTKKISYLDTEIAVRLHFGEAEVRSAKDELDAYRKQCSQTGDTLTSLDYFLPWTKIWGAIPILAMTYCQDSLFGIVLIHLRTKFGIPVGIARSGNGAGQGSVVGDPADWCDVMEIVSKALLEISAVHTVLISAYWSDQAVPWANRRARGLQGRWQFRSTHNRLKLTGDYKATLERLSYKMRRNLRYYRKRTEAELNCRFVPELDGQQRHEAVLALHGKSIYAHNLRRALKLEDVLRSVAGHFAMGLQKSNGDWVSYVAGWRIADRTYVEWQLNDGQHDKLSISTVMRSFLLEHEAERHVREINFVGGTSEIWSRCCETSMCGELLAIRDGILGTLTRRVTLLLRPRGELAQLYRTGFSLSDSTEF